MIISIQFLKILKFRTKIYQNFDQRQIPILDQS